MPGVVARPRTPGWRTEKGTILRDSLSGQPQRLWRVDVSDRGACHLSRWERSASQGRERVLGKAALLMDAFRTDRYRKALWQSTPWLSDSKADYVLQSNHESRL
jgi:hypothetical protein